MAHFEVVETQGMKMIKAVINGETVRAESGALHYMQGDIELETKLPSAGGFLKAMVTKENIIRPTYTGTGEIFFGPPIFGEYLILDMNNESWILDQGAYVCSTIEIEVGVQRNKAVTALLGGEGLFQTKVEGSGQVVAQAWGPIQVIDLENDKLTVDGSFAIAREASLNFSAQKATKSILGSMASGEGIVNVIEGTGRVYLAPVPNIHQNVIDTVVSSIYIPSS
ncbi:MAG: AIM24 family protein [Lentisphaeria bacterium]|nr:AIM24 family protein [Lentisphaeria bacterium]NQZ69359.1 AIM24 family protein [Lentisphaeria bacterium]